MTYIIVNKLTGSAICYQNAPVVYISLKDAQDALRGLEDGYEVVPS